MANQQIDFLLIMGAIALVGIAAFLILLVARSSISAPADDGEGGRQTYVPRWYEFVLGFIALLVVTIVLVLQIWPDASPEVPEAPTETVTEADAETSSDAGTEAGAEADAEAQPPAEADPADWRTGSRGHAFFIVMMVLGGLAFIAFLILLFSRILRAGPGPKPAPAAPTHSESAEPTGRHTSSPLRLFGLLAFIIIVLILNWTALDRATQQAVMLSLFYPATLAVALVLLFDKASRSWSVKSAGESVREWMFCDAIVLLLILGYLNLRRFVPGEEQSYGAMFWDMVHIGAFFLAFWVVDRTTARMRFLFAYAVITLLPILLLIWRAVLGVVAPESQSWWETIWPVFLLALIFFLFEIVLLIASRDTDRHGIGGAKDAVFFILYGIALLIAIPEVAA
ncbi:MAG: hypothetical protein VCC99_07330 [Alphaproteobacteria bacterium]